MSWTDEDEDEFQRIESIPILEWNSNDRHMHAALAARRDLAIKIAMIEREQAVEKERRFRERHGPLYMAAIITAIAGLGSCGIAAATGWNGTLIAVGVIGIFVSAGLNSLNQKLTGTDR